MPRGTRKRRLLNPLKPQLLFAEQPRTGVKHEYGHQLRSAINPRSFISEPSRQDLPGTTWVSSQFASFAWKNVRRGGRGKSSALSTTSLSILSHAKKTTVYKYPSLIFERSSIVSQRGFLHSKIIRNHQFNSTASVSHNVASSNNLGKAPLNVNEQLSDVTVSPSPIGFECEKQNVLDSVQTNASKGCYTPNSTTLIPPHIETPKIYSDQHPSSVHYILFSANQPKTPPRTMKILVKDTPEREYGLKVTWRRRKNNDVIERTWSAACK